MVEKIGGFIAGVVIYSIALIGTAELARYAIVRYNDIMEGDGLVDKFRNRGYAKVERNKDEEDE